MTNVGPHSGEILTDFVTAMKFGIGLNKILNTVHVYPTLGEANKFIVGEWKRALTPIKTLKILEKFHSWRR